MWSKEITKKINIYKTMIKSYGAETWRITEKQKRRVEAELDTIRRSMRVSRRQRMDSDYIILKMGIKGMIVQDIEKKQVTMNEC